MMMDYNNHSHHHKTLYSPQPKSTLFLLLTILLLLFQISFSYTTTASSPSCELGAVVNNKLYSYSLASPVKGFPHGVLSEDGFYKVAANDTIIWFQLCDSMVFNHDPPRCMDCSGCGGPSRCGMDCSALVAKDVGGYFVCSSIGRGLNYDIGLIDRNTPSSGVNVTLSSNSNGINCSLSVSVFCDSKGIKEPHLFQKSGTCDYATVLRHPSGCPKVVAVHGKGLGWFGFLLMILLCALGAYLLVGAFYRFHFLGIRGIDVIPNLDFWSSIPHRAKSLFTSLVQKFRGPTYHHRSSYSPVNF